MNLYLQTWIFQHIKLDVRTTQEKMQAYCPQYSFSESTTTIIDMHKLKIIITRLVCI